MREIQNCLPNHTSPFFIRLRNSKWEESNRSYREKLSESRNAASARGNLLSGAQKKAEWTLSIHHIGDLAWGYFQAAIETCTLYDIRLTKDVCSCIDSSVKDFLTSQRDNALKLAASQVPGAPPVPPPSVVQELLASPLPRYNEILIALEKARVENDKAFARKNTSMTEKTKVATTMQDYRKGDRPDVLNVLIASPGDVQQEREAAVQAIHDWNAVHANPDTLNILLNPIRWETHSFPESGDRPQALLNRQIVEKGDILIGIFGARIGTPTGVAESGTIEEIEQFRQAGKYVALYFSNAPVPRDIDREQLDALQRYQDARRKDTKYEVFTDAEDLQRQVQQHLTGIVTSVAKPLHLGLWKNEVAWAPPGRPPLGFERKADEKSPSNNSALLDIISELEDNLDCACRPTTGEVYRRPSTQVWIDNRNKIELPSEILRQVKNSYNRISSWSDVVASGLKPAMGSMDLNMIVAEVRSSLPGLIAELQKLAAKK